MWLKGDKGTPGQEVSRQTLTARWGCGICQMDIFSRLVVTIHPQFIAPGQDEGGSVPESTTPKWTPLRISQPHGCRASRPGVQLLFPHRPFPDAGPFAIKPWPGGCIGPGLKEE